MIRIFIDSQSLPNFIGVPSEQAFDQRGTLPQARGCDIVVTTDPINQSYINYWRNLGYPIPKFLNAGPFESDKALSDLIYGKPEIQKQIKAKLNGHNGRLEFFHPSDREAQLANAIGIPAYMNFDFATEYQKKNSFKELFIKVGIPTLPFIDMTLASDLSWNDLVNELDSDQLIAKKVYGSGGKSLGMITPLNCEADFLELDLNEGYIIEPQIQVKREIAVHWEILTDGQVRFIGYFGQIGENLSYVGTEFPVSFDRNLRKKLDDGFKRLTSEILALGGLGYMCCDVLVDEGGNIFWSDLNPRKGAILFIFDAIRRLRQARRLGKVSILHKHFSETKIRSFEQVQEVLGDLLNPANGNFVLITNPGAIEYGYLDVTCVCRSKNATNPLMEKVEGLIY